MVLPCGRGPCRAARGQTPRSEPQAAFAARRRGLRGASRPPLGDGAADRLRSRARIPHDARKKDVLGLPAGAKIQCNKKTGINYVCFPYSFRKANGEPGQERDYLGTVDCSVTPPRFKPNTYYLTVQPVRERRPIERWKDEGQRAKHEALLKEEQAGGGRSSGSEAGS